MRFCSTAISATVYFYSAAVMAQWTEPVLLSPPINTNPPGQYYYAAISADGSILCMTIIGDPAGYGDDDVYISERTGDSAWTVPANAGPNINNWTRNLSPSITNDRQRLYYVSWSGSSYDIRVSERTGPSWDDWSPGVPLPEPINRGREFTAQIGHDDSTLIFTSTGQPGPLYGEDAMYSSRLQPDGTWSEPVAIAPHLNSLTGSIHPCLTDSGRTLVYAQWIGLDMDILYAFHNNTGFGEAVPCDSTINASFWDGGPSCPVDGSLLYFDSAYLSPSGARRLFVARRCISSTPLPRRTTNTAPGIQVVPNFGDTQTLFHITIPEQFKGESIKIVNVLGQLVGTIAAPTHRSLQYSWRGGSHERQTLPNGVYFLLVSDKQNSAIGKLTLIK